MPIAALCVEIGEKEANNLREFLDFDKKWPISEIVSNSTCSCFKALCFELIFFETKSEWVWHTSPRHWRRPDSALWREMGLEQNFIKEWFSKVAFLLAVQDSSIGDIVTQWHFLIFERLLRDFCETIERLLRDFWETFERLLSRYEICPKFYTAGFSG